MIGKPQREVLTITNHSEVAVGYTLLCSFTPTTNFRIRLDGQLFAGFTDRGILPPSTTAESGGKTTARQFIIEVEALEEVGSSEVGAITLGVDGRIHDIAITASGIAKM